MRQFLALELGDRARGELARWRAALQERCSGWRWVDPGGVHLTLRFLGEVSGSQDDALRGRWRRVAADHGPFEVRLSAPGTFPARGRPRVLWVSVTDGPRGPLARLSGGLERAAREAGLDPDERPFRPHLTLARARRGERPAVCEPWPEPHAVASPARELVLFLSRLGAGGARYTALERFPFLAAPVPRVGRRAGTQA